jgi:tetratricopeptide (TPR) repeat protein
MSRRRPLGALLALALGAASMTTSSSAAAELSVWSLAREPKLRTEEQVRRNVDQLLATYQYHRNKPTTVARVLLLRDAKRQLDKVKAARSRDPLLRYQLAQVHYGLYEFERDDEHLATAAKHYRWVARSSAPALVRADALNELAICHARLGHHGKETAAYGQALAIEPHVETRAVLLANRAEGFMVQGRIEEAVRGYRASLASSPSVALHVLGPTTYWGLAVALDRAGDLEGAFKQITLARSYDPGDVRLSGPNWFYVPSYDEHWYQALGFWHLARVAPRREVKLQSYLAAIGSWARYINAAAPTDHWLALAVQRQRQCEREHAELLARPAKRPAKRRKHGRR